MMSKEGVWETIQELLAKAFAKSNSEWIEKTLGIKPEKFFEHVAVEIVAALSAAAIIAVIGIVGSRRIWRATRRKFRAATIRKTASTSFVIVRCPIANDSNDAIGNEISGRLETAFRAFAGWGETGGRPFHVVEFPLALAGDEGTKTYDNAIETAKRWLEKTDGDILIWGKRVKGESVGMIRLIGKDRKKGVIEVRRVDFDRRAAEFDQALANAIAYEVARLTQVTLSEPELVDLNVLRDVSGKLQALAASDAPALSNKWRERMSAEHRRLIDEIVRRTPNVRERGDLETEARHEIGKIDSVRNPLRFGELALRIAILIRKRNWSSPKADEIKEGHVLLDKATVLFDSVGDVKRSAEVRLEQLSLQQISFSLLPTIQEVVDIYFSEARHRIKIADDPSLVARFKLAESISPWGDDIGRAFNLKIDNFSDASQFIIRVIGSFDNGELLDLAYELSRYIVSCGDKTQNERLWRIPPQILQEVLASRRTWSPEELNYLHALIADASNVVAVRFALTGEELDTEPYADLSRRFTAKIVRANLSGGFGYIELRMLITLYSGAPPSPAAVDVLRACAGEKSSAFPRLQHRAKESLVIVLNNYAREYNSLEAAEEALQLARELASPKGYAKHVSERYAVAYAAWQVATLAPLGNRREEASSEAHALLEETLLLASEEGNQFFSELAQRTLREIEANFPALAADASR